MFARCVNQNFWTPDDFSGVRVPDAARQFLMQVGLPTFVTGFWLEFGVFDGDLPYLIIGVDDEKPVVIDEEGCVLVLGEQPGEEWYCNSSVENLSRFLFEVEAFCLQAHDDDAALQHEYQALRDRLRQVDPEGMADAPRHVWPVFLDNMEALAKGPSA